MSDETTTTEPTATELAEARIRDQDAAVARAVAGRPPIDIDKLNGEGLRVLGRLSDALAAANRFRQSLRRIQGLCGHPDAGQACRNVLAVAGEALAGPTPEADPGPSTPSSPETPVTPVFGAETGGPEPEAEHPADPWVRVTADDTSLPPAGEAVLVWTDYGPDFAAWRAIEYPERDRGQMRWDNDNWNRPAERDYVLAWRREAGPGWLTREPAGSAPPPADRPGGEERET